jgi:hypothetical protein
VCSLKHRGKTGGVPPENAAESLILSEYFLISRIIVVTSITVISNLPVDLRFTSS